MYRHLQLIQAKMVNAPDGLNQVILRSLNWGAVADLSANNNILCMHISMMHMPMCICKNAFRYVAIWKRKPCEK